MLDSFVLYSILTKWVLYVCTFGAVGTCFFQWSFINRKSVYWQKCTKLVIGFALASLVVSLMRFSANAVMLAGDFSGVFDPRIAKILWEGPSGEALDYRVVGTLVLLGAYIFRGPHLVFSLLGCYMILISYRYIGHVTELTTPFRNAILVLHITVVAFWVGSLIPLYWLAGGKDLQKAGDIAHRFGKIAAQAVPLLIVAGLIYAYLLLDSFSDVFTTAYGRFLLLKIALVSVVLFLAAMNKTRFVPEMLNGNPASGKHLRQSIVLESVFILGIFFVTSILTTSLNLG